MGFPYGSPLKLHPLWPGPVSGPWSVLACCLRSTPRQSVQLRSPGASPGPATQPALLWPWPCNRSPHQTDVNRPFLERYLQRGTHEIAWKSVELPAFPSPVVVPPFASFPGAVSRVTPLLAPATSAGAQGAEPSLEPRCSIGSPPGRGCTASRCLAFHWARGDWSSPEPLPSCAWETARRGNPGEVLLFPHEALEGLGFQDFVGGFSEVVFIFTGLFHPMVHVPKMN